MKFARTLIAYAIWVGTCAGELRGQAPRDVAITRRAMSDLAFGWTVPDTLGKHACLWGHQEASVIVIDSTKTIFVAEPDSTMCAGFIGATGFYRGYVGEQEETAALKSVARVLALRPDWFIVGIVHDVVPVAQDGTWVPAPLMWRAVRAFQAEHQT